MNFPVAEDGYSLHPNGHFHQDIFVFYNFSASRMLHTVPVKPTPLWQSGKITMPNKTTCKVRCFH